MKPKNKHGISSMKARIEMKLQIFGAKYYIHSYIHREKKRNIKINFPNDMHISQLVPIFRLKLFQC